MTLLRVLCFCDPEGIPISILKQGCDALHPEDRCGLPKIRPVNKLETVKVQRVDKLEAAKDLFRSRMRLSKAIQEIQRLSLAAYTLEESDRIIRIHDLVHLLLRSKLMTETERGQWLEIAIYIVYKAFEEIGDHGSPQNSSRCGRFISHIESLEGFAKQYGLEDTKLLEANTWAGLYLNDCGLYQKAAMLSKRTLEQKKAILGGRHPSTLTSMNNLASVLERLGKYGEAEGIHRQTLGLRESKLGKEHPDTLASVFCLANLLHQKKQHQNAELLYQRACAGYKKTLGDRHPDTMACLRYYSLMLEEENGIENETAINYGKDAHQEAEA